MNPPKFYQSLSLVLFVFFLGFGSVARAAEETAPADTEAQFLDVPEALASKQYVRRTILSTIIKSSPPLRAGRPYINHIMGVNAVFQRTTFAKYVTGIQGLSLGYVTSEGHGFELGAELSAVSNIFAGYRYFARFENFSLWPFIGGGVGKELTSIKFAEGPPESLGYNGTRNMLFGSAGLLVPLVDVALKLEMRFNFYGMDRWVLTEGLGAIIFL